MFLLDKIMSFIALRGDFKSFHRFVSAHWSRVLTASHDKLNVYMRARRPPCLFYLDPLRVHVIKMTCI